MSGERDWFAKVDTRCTLYMPGSLILYTTVYGGTGMHSFLPTGYTQGYSGIWGRKNDAPLFSFSPRYGGILKPSKHIFLHSDHCKECINRSVFSFRRVVSVLYHMYS